MGKKDWETSRWDLPFTDDPEIELDVDAYSLRVEPVHAGEPAHLEVRGSNKAPKVVVERAGNAVRVSIRHEGGIPFIDWIPWAAASTLVLRVPPRLRGTIHTGAGTIRLHDLNACELELSTDAGTIRAERIRGKLRLKTSAGTIDGDDLAGSIDALTDAGTIDLRVGELDPGTHRVHTSAGTVRVDLSRDVQVRIDASSSFGGSRVNFPSTPNAAASLVVTSDAGSVRVRASDKITPPPRVYAPHSSEAGSPYRQRPAPIRAETALVPAASDVPIAAAAHAVVEEPNDEELERVLQMVADGKLTPLDATEILRALGHG